VPRSVGEGPTEEEGLIVCFVCEAQFDVMSAQFNNGFSDYLAAHKNGETRDTPAKRVHDLAFEHQDWCSTISGRAMMSWFLAIAMERLVALECAGVPT
jgi:hypothetical protein